VKLMQAMGVDRQGSRPIVDAEGRRCMVDVYVLEDGFELMAGYPVSAMPNFARGGDKDTGN